MDFQIILVFLSTHKKEFLFQKTLDKVIY